MKKPRQHLAFAAMALALALGPPLTAADDPTTIEAGDTPTLTLEQTGSFGFLPQSWQVGANEVGFFVQDSTSGLSPAFRVFQGTGSAYAFVITAGGDVGMGTDDPEAALHVINDGDTNDTDFLVEEVSSTEAARVMATLRNNGRVLLLLEDSSANGTIWRFRSVGSQFNLDSDNGVGNELVLDSSGNLTILGTLTQNSNREAKSDVRPVDPEEVLLKVAALPVSTWTYKKDQGVLHLGPMAQDFYDTFGLGPNNLGISSYDVTGVALTAIQALQEGVEQKRGRLDSIEHRLAALEAQLTH